MTIALWVIAVCEVLRVAQNMVQLNSIKHSRSYEKRAYQEFVKSLNQSDKEFVKRILKEIEKETDSEG